MPELIITKDMRELAARVAREWAEVNRLAQQRAQTVQGIKQGYCKSKGIPPFEVTDRRYLGWTDLQLGDEKAQLADAMRDLSALAELANPQFFTSIGDENYHVARARAKPEFQKQLNEFVRLMADGAGYAKPKDGCYFGNAVGIAGG